MSLPFTVEALVGIIPRPTYITVVCVCCVCIVRIPLPHAPIIHFKQINVHPAFVLLSRKWRLWLTSGISKLRHVWRVQTASRPRTLFGVHKQCTWLGNGALSCTHTNQQRLPVEGYFDAYHSHGRQQLPPTIRHKRFINRYYIYTHKP